jgi:serine/threonine protein kinase
MQPYGIQAFQGFGAQENFQTQQVLKTIGNYTYDLKDKLGEGTFGQVFKGKDKSEKEVAIKVISRRIIDANQMMENSLYNEIEIMKALRSPNIVKLIDVIYSNNNVYIVQEFCRGGDLRKALKKREYFPEEEAKNILIDVLSGFKELLKAGVVHRDLKPENILINDGLFKLADFGLARYVNNVKKDVLKSAVGTPLYMSPQIHYQTTYSSKSEIWSIGLIYYELLFGKIPWDFTNQYDLVILEID